MSQDQTHGQPAHRSDQATPTARASPPTAGTSSSRTPASGCTPARSSRRTPTPGCGRPSTPAAGAPRRPADRPDARATAPRCASRTTRRSPPPGPARSARRPPAALRPRPARRRPRRRPSDPAQPVARCTGRTPRPPAAARADGRGRRRRGRPPLHDRHRLPRPPRRAGRARPRDLGLARQGAPVDRRRRSPRRWAPPSCAYEQDRRSIQRDFDGPRTIAFLNPKGGAAKTTGVLAAGYTFGTVRGGGVVAWDNNETRGTLGIRGTRSTHRNTTRELLEDLERFSDVYQARIGDLGAFVRSQGDAHFDVLASDERPDVTGMIRAQDFTAVHQLLERFYRVILIDTGNNMRAENWLAAAECRRPAGRDQHGPRGHRLQRPVDARRPAGRRLPGPQAQDGHRAVRPVRRTSTSSSPTTWSQVYEQRTKRGLPRALRPGAGRRLGGALRPAVRGHPDGRGSRPAPGWPRPALTR